MYLIAKDPANRKNSWQPHQLKLMVNLITCAIKMAELLILKSQIGLQEKDARPVEKYSVALVLMKL